MSIDLDPLSQTTLPDGTISFPFDANMYFGTLAI
jgi:hypothetical protein